MSDKFEGAVAALSGIVELAAKPTIRKVRTVEGQKKYGQPIGSVIITDPSGKVLDTLYKGHGTTNNTPSTSSFGNDPKVAKHGAVLPGQGAFAEKAKSAFDKPASSAPGPTAVEKVDNAAKMLDTGSKQQKASTNTPKAQSTPAMVYDKDTALKALSEAGLTASEIEFAEEIASNVDEVGLLTKQKWTAEQYGTGAGTVTTSKSHQVPRPGNKAWDELATPSAGSNLTETSARIRAAVGVLLSAHAVTDVNGNLRRTSGKHITENLDAITEELGSGAEASYTWFKETFDPKFWKAHQNKPTVSQDVPSTPKAAAADPFAGVPKQTFHHPEFGEMSVPFEAGDKAFVYPKGITVKKPDGSAVTVRGDIDKTFATKAKVAESMGVFDNLGEAISPTSTTATVDKADKVDWTGKSPNAWQASYEALADGEMSVSNVKAGTKKDSKGRVWVGFSVQKGGKIWNLGDGVQGVTMHKGAWVGPGDNVYINSNGTIVKISPDGSGSKTSPSGFENQMKDANKALNSSSILVHEQEFTSSHSDPAAPPASAPKASNVVEKSGTWLLTVEGNQKSIPVSKGDKVWSDGTIGDFYVEKADGSAKNYSWNYDFWGSNVSKEFLDKKKAAGLAPVNGPEQAKNAKAGELSDADAKVVGKLAAATNLPEGSFSAAIVPTPKGEQKVFVTPDAKVYVTGTGAAVLYEDGTSVKFNPLSGKIVTGKIPATATEIKIDAPEAPNVEPSSAPAEPVAAPAKKTKVSAGAISKILSDSGETKSVSSAGMVKGMPIVDTGFIVKQNKTKSGAFGDNTDVTVTYDFKNHWTKDNEGSEGAYALEKMEKYKALLEAQGYSVELKEKAFGQTYASLTVKPFSEEAPSVEPEAPSSATTELDNLLAKLKKAAAESGNPLALQTPDQKAQSDALQEAQDKADVAPATKAFDSVSQAAKKTTSALQTLQDAAAGITAEKSVKGTKYGTDSNGSKGWEFITHTSANGSLVYTDSDEWGNVYLYEIGTSEPISGPHAQMKEAKAWLAANGKEGAPNVSSAALPETHDVPDTAKGKVKPASAKTPEKKPAAKVAAPEQSTASTEESFFTPSPLGKVATVPHPKYGDVSVEYKDGDKVYTTGVGVVVKSADGSGLVKSGKTGKVDKFEVLPDNKLPASSTVEIKKKSSTPEDTLAKAVANQNQKDIESALKADTPAPAEPVVEPSSPKIPGELFGDGDGAVPNVLSTAISQDALPTWMHKPLTDDKVDQLWLLKTADQSKYSLVARLPDGTYKMYFSDSDGGAQDTVVPLPSFDQKKSAYLLWDGTDPDFGFSFPPPLSTSPELPEWEKELLDSLKDTGASGLPQDAPSMQSADSVSAAVEKGNLPSFMGGGFLDEVESVTAIPSGDGYGLLVKYDDTGYAYYVPTATSSGQYQWMSSVGSDLDGHEMWNHSDPNSTYPIQKATQVDPAIPDLPAETKAESPTVNAENAVSKPVKGDWIKGKKTDEGYLLIGVSDADGNPVVVTKESVYGWGNEVEWKTPWGFYNTLKAAKAGAAKHGVIDHSKVKDPLLTKKKISGKKSDNKAPAGSELNALGVPEVEWKGQRFLLLPGTRMFEDEGSLYIFDGSSGVKISESGSRITASMSQKALKDSGATQIAYGGSLGLGKYDFSQHADPSTTWADVPNHVSFAVLADLHESKDLARMAAYADFLENHAPSYYQSNAKKMLKSLEVLVALTQVEKTFEDTGKIDGAQWAKVAGSLDSAEMSHTALKTVNEYKIKYAIAAAETDGFSVGDNIDDLDVAQVKALAASRGFGPAAYIKTPAEARVWLLTEYSRADSDTTNPRNNLLAALQHQKVLSKIAIGQKYDKYLAQPATKSDVETAVPEAGQSMQQAVDLFASNAGVTFDTNSYGVSQNLEKIYSNGNIVAAAMLSSDPQKAFDALPEAAKQAFYTRLSVHGPTAISHADFGSGYLPNSAKDAYRKIAEGAPQALTFEPHLATLQKKYSPENIADLKISDAAKPEGVSTTTWALIMGALEQGDEVDLDLLPPASEFSGDVYAQLGVPPTLVADAPPVVKQLLAYGAQTQSTNAYGKSLGEIAKTGVWGKPWADTYQVEDGPLLYLSPGDKVFSHYSGAVVYNEFFPESAYMVQYGDIKPAAAYYLSGVIDGEPVKAVPVSWDFDTAKGFVPQLDEKTFDALMGAVKGDYTSAAKDFPTGGSGKGDSILAVKNFFDTKDFGEQHPTLKEMGVAAMPSGALAALHNSSITGDSTVPQLLEVFANYGHFSPKKKTDAEIWVDTLNLDPKAAYFSHLSKATDGSSLYYSINGSPNPVSQYMALASAVNGKEFSNITELEVEYDAFNFHDITVKIWDQLQGELGKVEKPKTDHDELQLSKINKSLGGMHSKQVWVDQHGNEWMTKAFPSDPNGDYRVDVEHTANEIARLYGYNAPATRVMELEGKHQYVQLLAPASGELGSQPWSSMPETVVIDAMTEHVIDWVISNHDSHNGNILKTPDGQHAYGIDKGQAGRFFGKDKLVEGYQPNPEPAWYDNVYAAIRTGQMSKEQADSVRDAVLRKAAQVATRNEDRFTELMQASQKNRVSFPSKYPNAQAWVDAHNARRKASFDDFAKLYKDLYEKAGYEWGGKDTLDDYLPKKIDDKFHVAPSEDLVEGVKKYGTLGVPLFYKTGVFADDSMLVYKTKKSDGSDTLRANATLLPDADQTFMTWLKSHTIEKVHTTNNPMAVEEPSVSHAEMPQLSTAYNALVNYAKTVNTHAQDGNYTQTTVDNGVAAQQQLKGLYDKVKATAEADPTALHSETGAKFYTHEQQDTWLAHANRMLQQFENVTKAKAQGVKVSVIADDTPFQMPVYKPSEGLDTSGTPKVVDAYDFNGVIEQKWSDGNYTSTDLSGKTAKSTKGDYGIAASNGEQAQSYITKDAPAEVETSDEAVESIVSVANVPVKVSYQPSSSFAKKSSDGFEVVEDGKKKVGFTGHEYQIEVGDITIKYQGLEDKSVARAQRGLARIEMGNWDGNPDALEKVNELFESIGLDIGDATEQTMEIGYYRRLAATANRRKLSDKYKALVSKKIAKTGDQAEVDAYRELLEGVYGKGTMKEFYDSKGWLPYMKEGSQGGVAGTVQWMRPDYSVEDLQGWWGGTNKLPAHSIKNGHALATSMAKTGYFSTEHRMRVLGEWINGQSSDADQVQHGSSEYLYFRPANYGYVDNHAAYLEPEYAISGSVYGASYDAWGSTSNKVQSSPFDLRDHAKTSTTEILIKNGLTLFDGIAIMQVSASQKKEILDYYEKLGVTEIRGMPISERIVTTSAEVAASSKKVWDLAKKAEQDRKSKKGL